MDNLLTLSFHWELIWLWKDGVREFLSRHHWAERLQGAVPSSSSVSDIDTSVAVVRVVLPRTSSCVHSNVGLLSAFPAVYPRLQLQWANTSACLTVMLSASTWTTRCAATIWRRPPGWVHVARGQLAPVHNHTVAVTFRSATHLD